jgi:hypothetical protein
METLISLKSAGDNDNNIVNFWKYCLSCKIPYVYFSETYYLLSIIFMIAYTTYIHLLLIDYILLSLNIISILCLISTRFFISKSDSKISGNIIGILREITLINDKSLYLFIIHNILFFISVNYLFAIIVLNGVGAEDLLSETMFLQSLSIYLFIVNRIYRSAFRDDPLRSVIELLIPEISLDYYDSIYFILLSLKLTSFEFKMVSYTICLMWNISILLRSIYLTLVYFPYSYESLWRHLGFFEHSYLDELRDTSVNRYIIAYKVRMLLAYCLLATEVLASGVRAYIMYFNIEQSELLYALAFKNMMGLYKFINTIILYRKVQSVTEADDSIYHIFCWGVNKKYVIGVLVGITYLTILVLKAYLSLLYSKIFDGFLNIPIVFLVLFGIDNLVLLSLMIYSLISRRWVIMAIYSFIATPLINYPILYFNYKYLPLAGPSLIDTAFSQKGIYIIFSASIAIFYLHYYANNISKPTSTNINARVVLATSITSTIISECIIDYLSSLNFFFSYKLDIPLSVHIVILSLSIAEYIFSGYYILAVSKRTKFGVFLSQQSLNDMKAKIKLLRLFFETICFAVRLYLLIRFKDDSNIFIFKNLSRITISIAAIERVVNRNYETSDDDISGIRFSNIENNIDLQKRDNYVACCKKSYEILKNYEINNFTYFIIEMMNRKKISFCRRLKEDVIKDFCSFF